MNISDHKVIPNCPVVAKRSLPREVNHTHSSNIDTPTATTKRPYKRRNLSLSESEAKRYKMDSEELKAILRNNQVENNLKLDTMTNSINSLVKAEIAKVSSRFDELDAARTAQDERINSLEGKLDNLSEKLNPDHLRNEIREEVSKQLTGPQLAAHKMALSKELEGLSNILIVRGIKIGNNSLEDAVKQLVSTLQISTEDQSKIEIVKVVQLGKELDTGFSCKVILNSNLARNLILTKSSNAPKGTYLDRELPRSYRTAYTAFKSEAFRLRKAMNVATQIIVSGHLLILRYRKPGPNSAYIIWREFFPSVESCIKTETTLAGNNHFSNLNEANRLSQDEVNDAKRTLIITGLNCSPESGKNRIKEHMDPDISSIDSIEQGKDCFLVKSTSVEKCAHLLKTYRDKKIGNSVVKLDMLT